jgi:copper chaperone CopZ
METMQQTFAMTGMRCQGCARKLENALAEFSEGAEIDFPSATVRLRNPSATLDELNAKLADLGAYKLTPVAAANEDHNTESNSPAKNPLTQYLPLALIFAYLAACSCANAASGTDWMRHFMAGFFLVFSFFKLLNLRAFASSYAMYDLIAARWKSYGLIYPFIELGLGFAYLFVWQMQLVLWATLAVSIISGVGVLNSMRRKQTIRCACLGSELNVPVSTVTLVEDFGMALMAGAMLIF